jgi:hypothetical protein
MSKRDTKKARKSVEKRTRPEAIQCPTCTEFYTPGGPQDKYHTSGACARC